MEGAGAAPLLRDGRRSGALADLRRPGALLRRPAGRDDRQRLEVDEPDVGGVPLDLRSRHPLGRRQAKDDAAKQLFDLLVFKPWVVLELRRPRTLRRSPAAAPTTPTPNRSRCGRSPRNPEPRRRARPAAVERRPRSPRTARSASTTPTSTPRTSCASASAPTNATPSTTRSITAMPSKLPDADTAKAGYRLGVADKPATDAMEEGGQYQRLLVAIVVFVGELGAFSLLGSLSVGVILAQVLLLLLLAFAPVALVAAAIPGRGHDFFKGWLEKLAGYLLRKAAYSLILAILLAVNGALASATSELGWLMSFGLQALFFWAVFLQRKTLADSLSGSRPGRARRAATAPCGCSPSMRAPARWAGRFAASSARPLRRRAPREGYSAAARTAAIVAQASLLAWTARRRASAPATAPPLGMGAPSLDPPGPAEFLQARGSEAGRGQRGARRPPAPRPPRDPALPVISSARKARSIAARERVVARARSAAPAAPGGHGGGAAPDSSVEAVAPHSRAGAPGAIAGGGEQPRRRAASRARAPPAGSRRSPSRPARRPRRLHRRDGAGGKGGGKDETAQSWPVAVGDRGDRGGRGGDPHRGGNRDGGAGRRPRLPRRRRHRAGPAADPRGRDETSHRRG